MIVKSLVAAAAVVASSASFAGNGFEMHYGRADSIAASLSAPAAGSFSAASQKSSNVYYGRLNGNWQVGEAAGKGMTFGLSVAAAQSPNSFAATAVPTGTLQVDPVTAVPEPSTYALLLAGLGLVGFLSRRRANRA